MKRESIFFSDEDPDMQENKQEDSKIEDIDSMILSMISSSAPEKNEKQNLPQQIKKEKDYFFDEFYVCKIEEKELNVLTQLNTDIKFQTSSQTLTKRERNKDQNICKKIHKIANKTLKTLGLYDYLKKEKKKIHKKNYFVFALMIVKKASKLKQFIKLYKDYVAQEIKKSKCLLQTLSSENKKYKKTKCFIDDVGLTIYAIQKFEIGKIHQCLMKLFDIENIKRKKCIEQAYTQVVEFNQTIQIK